jgi:hypothetical protein
MSTNDEIDDFFNDYEESKNNKLKMLIEEFPFDNLSFDGLETFDIKPVLSKSENIIITDINTKKSNNKNLF